jgi:hypothetical protein
MYVGFEKYIFLKGNSGFFIYKTSFDDVFCASSDALHRTGFF